MPTFQLERNGVPFTVTEAESKEVAEQILTDEITEKPETLQATAAALGMDWDVQTNIARERTVGERFAIGAGRAVSNATEFINDVFNADELTALEINRRDNETKAFEILDDLGIADDFGAFSANVGMLMLGGGAGVARLAIRVMKGAGSAGFQLAKMASGFNLVGAAARQFVKSGAKNKITGSVMGKAAQQPAGRAAIKKLAESTNPKTVKTLVDIIAKQADKPVQAANVAATRALRAQATRVEAEGVQTAVSAQGELAAAQGAARTTAAQRGGQEALKSDAKGALKVPRTPAKPVETAAQRAKLIEGIGFKPGGGNPTSQAAQRQALKNLIKRS